MYRAVPPKCHLTAENGLYQRKLNTENIDTLFYSVHTICWLTSIVILVNKRTELTRMKTEKDCLISLLTRESVNQELPGTIPRIHLGLFSIWIMSVTEFAHRGENID